MKAEHEPVVYNYGSAAVNPISFKNMKEIFDENYIHTDTSLKSIWTPFVLFTTNPYLFWVMHIVFHFIPACIADLILIIMGKKPRAVSAFFFGTKLLGSMEYFGDSSWKIMINETQKAISQLNSIDKEIFYCDLRPEFFIWKEYLIILWRGIRMYIMKDKIDPAASYRRYIQLLIMHYGVILVLMYCLISWLLKLII